MARPDSLVVPEDQQSTLAAANRDSMTLKQKLHFLVRNGETFPALAEIDRLLTIPDSTGAYRELVKTTSQAKVVELTGLLAQLESSCTAYAEMVLSLGAALNSQEVLDGAVSDLSLIHI